MLYLLNFYNPQRNKRTAKAIARGWPSFLVVIMQVSCHLTVCGQGLTIAYMTVSLHGGFPQVRAVLRCLNWSVVTIVGIFWQVLLRVRLTRTGPSFPWTMFPRDEFPKSDKDAEWVVARLLAPSKTPLVAMFSLLQLQHTLMPLAPWLEQFLWPEPPTLSLAAELGLLLVYAACWLVWAIGICWHVRGAPPYPVLGAAYKEGAATWMPIYAGIIGSGCVCACAAHYF